MSDPSPETLAPERLSELERDLDQLEKALGEVGYLSFEDWKIKVRRDEFRALLRAARERDAMETRMEWTVRDNAKKAVELADLREDVKALAEAARNVRENGLGHYEFIALRAALARPGIRALLGEEKTDGK